MANRTIFQSLTVIVFLALAPLSHARWYNVNTGRFITMDTYKGDMESPASLHKYLYCADDPVNLSDPQGSSYGDKYNTVDGANGVIWDVAADLFNLQRETGFEWFSWIYDFPRGGFSYTKPYTTHSRDGVDPDQAPPFNLEGWIHYHPGYWNDFGANENFSSKHTAFTDKLGAAGYLVTPRYGIKQYFQGNVTIIKRPSIPPVGGKIVNSIGGAYLDTIQSGWNLDPF